LDDCLVGGASGRLALARISDIVHSGSDID